MPFTKEGYDPETIQLLDEVLAKVCELAAAYRQVTPALRETFAGALIEATTLGIQDRDELVTFALRTLPQFRKASGA